MRLHLFQLVLTNFEFTAVWPLGTPAPDDVLADLDIGLRAIRGRADEKPLLGCQIFIGSKGKPILYSFKVACTVLFTVEGEEAPNFEEITMAEGGRTAFPLMQELVASASSRSNAGTVMFPTLDFEAIAQDVMRRKHAGQT